MPQGMSKIEVLIVLFIIGALGTVAGVAVSTARERTRDATRLAHVRELQDALEMYFTDHSEYPLSEEVLALGQTTSLCLSDDGFACTIAPADAYLSNVPTPPSQGIASDAYLYLSDSETYRIQFELEGGNSILGLKKGKNCATPTEIVAGACQTE